MARRPAKVRTSDADGEAPRSALTGGGHPAGVVTRDDVARAAGVSLATAALALNDHPRVASKTRERVAQAAGRLGYVPNHAGRRLAGMRADARSRAFGQVGLLYFLEPGVGGEAVFLSVLGGIEEALAKLSASLVLVRIGGPEDWAKFDRLVQSGMVDGWLLFGNVDEDVLARVTGGGVKHVVLGDHRCAGPGHTVNVDFHGVGMAAAGHFAGLGHRRVGYFAGSMRHKYQGEMLAGFEEGMRALGLAWDAGLVAYPKDVFPDPTKAGEGSLGHEASNWDEYVKRHEEHLGRLHSWLRARPGVTGIFASEFEWAQAVWSALGELKVKVPGEVSVLGCEPLVRWDRHAFFSRVVLPMHEMGRQGARLLHTCMGPAGEGAGHVKISGVLRQGASTRRVAGATETDVNTGKDG